MLLLNNSEIVQLLDMKSCIEVLEETVRAGETGDTGARPATSILMPKINTSGPSGAYKLETHDGIARLKNLGALRIMSDNLTIEKLPDGSLRRRKIPTAQGGRYVGLILLFDTESSELSAILPDAEIQRRRVAGTGALASKYVARADAHILGILGSGWQAETAVLAQCQVRDISQVRVFSPNREHREAFCAKMRPELSCPIEAVATSAEAIRAADIVVAVTDTVGPAIDGRLLESGAHVTFVRNNELDEVGYQRCDVIVEGARPEKGDPSYWSKQIHDNRFYVGGREQLENSGLAIGDWVKKGGYRPATNARRVSLPEIMLGHDPGRRKDDEISCFFISAPTGPQLAYIGALILEEARRRGLGRDLPNEWFSEKEKD